MFEFVLNTAVASWLIANGVNDPAKQNDDKGLITPRVEVKSVFGPWGPTPDKPHLWIAEDGTSWPDCRDGTLYMKIVTRRGDDTQDHDRLVGTVRALLQDRSEISQKMTLHTLNRLAEGGSVPDFDQAQNQVLTALSFSFRMSILYATKTAEIFPT